MHNDVALVGSNLKQQIRVLPVAKVLTVMFHDPSNDNKQWLQQNVGFTGHHYK